MNISYNPTTSVDNHAFGMVEANKGNTTIVVFLFVIIVVFYLMFSFLGIGGLGNGSDALSSSGANANNGSSGFSLFGSAGHDVNIYYELNVFKVHCVTRPLAPNRHIHFGWVMAGAVGVVLFVG